MYVNFTGVKSTVGTNRDWMKTTDPSWQTNKRRQQRGRRQNPERYTQYSMLQVRCLDCQEYKLLVRLS